MLVTQKSLIDWIKNETTSRLNIPGISGFYIQRLKSVGGSFRITYRYKGRRLTYVIGRFPAMTLIEAQRIAHELYVRIQSGENINESSNKNDCITPLDYLEKYYIKVLSGKRTGRELESNIRRSFKRIISKPLGDITPTDIINWQNEKEAEGLSYATLVKHYNSFKAMLSSAVKAGIIPSNPLDACSLENRGSIRDRRRVEGRVYLTPSQSRMFLDGLKKYDEYLVKKRELSRYHGKPYLPSYKTVHYPDRVHVSMLILYYNGFRIGDVITLDWREVLLNKKIFYFAPNKIQHKKPLPQSFPMNDIVFSALTKWWIQNSKPTEGPVFISPKTGTFYVSSSFRAPWRIIKELSGLPKHLHLQTLRHNFASQLIMKGQDVFTVAQLMATSVKMIEDYYGHLKPDHKFDAINKMLDI